MLALLLLLVTACPVLAQEVRGGEFCAFQVTVTKDSGAPEAYVPYEVVDVERKSTFLSGTADSNGLIRICDVPLRYVDIVVGRDLCGSVSIRHLKPSWPKRQDFHVVLTDAPCDHFTHAALCQVVVRVKTRAGRPVSGAQFTGKPEAAKSDSLGRLFWRVRWHGVVRGTVAAGTGKPKPIDLLCDNDTDAEVAID